MLALSLVLSILIGVSLGLLGGGGSILTLPILKYVVGMDAHQAVAGSLFVVGATSATAMITHARAGRVRWRTGIVFGLAGMAGAFGAGRVAKLIPSTVLLVLFAVMMVVTAAAMLRGRRAPAGAAARAATGPSELPIGKVVVEGLVVGAVTGLVGAGGGFLVVPALVLLGGLPMDAAVGTSLLVIAMKSFAGFGGYLSSTTIQGPVLVGVTAAAIVGSVLGGWAAGKISQEKLRRAFGWFVVVMAVSMLSQELPALFGVKLAAHWSWLLAGATAILATIAETLRRKASVPGAAARGHSALG